ncbi:MAG: acyltransferase family protein [Spirochaetales bacterium]|nr:acyltransferase family protein [Spirochaetales bacterium]
MSTSSHPITQISIGIKRHYSLDWIRVFVVLLLIPFHTAVTFSHIGKGYVYTPEPIDSYFYIFISDFFNLWIMRLLFFVSGISAYMALKKRSIAAFSLERFKRLIIPVLFLVLTIGPLAGYVLAVSHFGFSGTFISYYPHFFLDVKRYLFWGQLWYCVYLYLLSMIALPLFSYLLKNNQVMVNINNVLMQKNNILFPLFIIALIELLLRPSYPGYQSFIGDWANVAVYFCFYTFGFIMGQSKDLIDRITGNMRMFLILALSSAILYLILKRAAFTEANQIQLMILSFLWGAAAYTWVMTIIGFTRKYLNKNNRLLKYLSMTSFSLYLFHYLILSLLNFFLLKTQLNPYLIWLITCVGTYLIFILLFELVLKRVAPLRYICGIRRSK